jgi:hypothetical protein
MNVKKSLFDRLRKSMREEAGSAMVVTILVMVVLTGMGAVVFLIGTNNIQNAGRDRLAAGAFGASEGGVAQGLSFIRTAGVATLKCDDPPQAGTDCTQTWGSANPKIVDLSNNRQFNTWIQRIQAFKPPAVKVGTYRIHSTGTAGTGPGRRLVDVTVNVAPFRFPIGVYADSITDAGSPTLRQESMFSQGCITARDKIAFVGTDPYHGIPSAAHSTQYIIDTKVNGACSATNTDNIHRPKPPASNPGVCNIKYPNDQDRQGGDLTGTSCYSSPYPTTSFFDLDALRSYGYDQPRGLTDAQYAALKIMAQEQGTYFTTDSFPTPTNPPPYLNAVYYFNLRPGGGTVNIQRELNAFGSAYCGQRSIVIVVEGGDMQVNSGADIVGAIFVPDGNYRGNGTALTTGTLFAKSIDKLTGDADFTLEGPTSSCFFDNFPGGLMEVSVAKFREVDRPLT